MTGRAGALPVILPLLGYGRGTDSMSPSVNTTSWLSSIWSLLQGCGISRMVARATAASSSVNMRSLLPRWSAVTCAFSGQVCAEETSQRSNGNQRPGCGRKAFVILSDTPRASGSAKMSDQLLAASSSEAHARAVSDAYRQHYELLYFIVASRFRLPEPEAENVVHDVFVNFIRHRDHIEHERAWLVAAVCNAARDYLKSPQRRTVDRLPERSAFPGDAIVARLDIAALMCLLDSKCRDVLYRRHVDGCSLAEIATAYATTTSYAKTLIHRCLTTARAMLFRSRRTV